MADKKMTAAEKKAAAEAAALAEVDHKEIERKRLIGAGAVLAAIALFVGGYAAGNSGDDDDSIFGADVVNEERDDDRRPSRDDERGRLPGQRGGVEGEDGFDQDGFEFPRGPRGGFDFPEGFDFPHQFDLPGDRGFGFDCSPSDAAPGGFHCEFDLPGGFGFGEDFDFAFPDRPFGNDGIPPEAAPPADELHAEPGFLGVQVTESPDGVVVGEVFPDSPAAAGGIETGDVIIAADARPIEVIADLVEIVSDAGAGTEVVVTVVRDGVAREFLVVLGERPS